MIRRAVGRCRALLALPDQLRGELRTLGRAIQSVSQHVVRQGKTDRALARDLATLRGETAALKKETAAFRADVDKRLLEYHLQLGRLAALVNGHSGPAPEVPTMAGRVPLVVAAANAAAPAATVTQPGSSHEWLTLDACPACATPERSIVCEWNKLALLETAPDERSRVYDYAVCHGCGILYATGRPIGGRYTYLLQNFEDVLEKTATSALLNPYPLTEEDRQRYRRLIARGVLVSDHEGGEYLDGVFKDRLENAGHVDLLGSLLDLRGARVLEVRSRAGTIVESLRRLYGADVYAMPIWESQQFIMRELYGIPTSDLIDFEHFAIPFEGPFDLVACNHMFNHMVHLDRFLAALHGAVRPGGHVYFYNEIDDGEFLDGLQSMIATMNPLHLQATDSSSLVRALGASGFETVFLKLRNKRILCLAKAVERPSWQPMRRDERASRVARYQRARDRAVLRVPEAVRPRFAGAWQATVERAVASGIAVLDERGGIRIVKQQA